MQMNNADIVKSYREAKDKKKQVSILAELNACEKEKIISILKEGGISDRELPRNRKKTESDGKSEKPMAIQKAQPTEKAEPKKEESPAAVTEELPEIVKEVICRQMEQEQEAIDYHSGRLKELNEFLRGKRYE